MAKCSFGEAEIGADFVTARPPILLGLSVFSTSYRSLPQYLNPSHGFLPPTILYVQNAWRIPKSDRLTPSFILYPYTNVDDGERTTRQIQHGRCQIHRELLVDCIARCAKKIFQGTFTVTFFKNLLFTCPRRSIQCLNFA